MTLVRRPTPLSDLVSFQDVMDRLFDERRVRRKNLNRPAVDHDVLAFADDRVGLLVGLHSRRYAASAQQRERDGREHTGQHGEPERR